MNLVIDIGSNSIKCLLGSFQGGKLEEFFEETRESRISAGSGKLVPNAAELISECINYFKSRSGEMSAGEVKVSAFATSALREFSDSRKLLEIVKKSSGIDVKILSEKQEAFFSKLGASSDPEVAKNGNNFSFFDLGGGSIEVVLPSMDGEMAYASLPLGAVRLTKAGVEGIVPTESEIKKISGECSGILQTALSKLERKIPEVEKNILVGTGGAASAVRKICAAQRGTDSPKISRELLESSLGIVSRLDPSSISETFGISRARAEILPAAFICIAELMKALKKEEFYHTFRNLRYGLLMGESLFPERL